jgi:hypothetical protein
VLRVECLETPIVNWSVDAWRSAREAATRDGGCGIHYVDLSTGDLALRSRVDFTFRHTSPEHSQGTHYSVDVVWWADPVDRAHSIRRWPNGVAGFASLVARIQLRNGT